MVRAQMPALEVVAQQIGSCWRIRRVDVVSEAGRNWKRNWSEVMCNRLVERVSKPGCVKLGCMNCAVEDFEI